MIAGPALIVIGRILALEKYFQKIQIFLNCILPVTHVCARKCACAFEGVLVCARKRVRAILMTIDCV